MSPPAVAAPMVRPDKLIVTIRLAPINECVVTTILLRVGVEAVPVTTAP